ncbi:MULTISPECIES: metal ABC transporter substrate-binding protein [Selenomonas]|jgi:metal cation ABC superfamily ATP binding cassette transporter, binding protein|uniref:metal ABC transporter substrate-binding protein n=1 Tax=Selenomonas TaxID=970 RepID=UPI0001EB2C32|nr:MULTISPECIES: metal ABC transporter substrate-binding protein [Selenomonas]EFR40633.1 ABC transporter, substrate-binding protein [Selenomonas sp. oral taxon 137 str. F0430]EJP33743.1 periplasmic solute-binding family protein [Selenomonas sp. FOBRC9]
MRSTTKILSLLMLVLSLALVGCGGTDKAAEKPADKQPAQPFRIVTSFYPMYVATINITQGVDGVEVHNMTKPQTGCLHDYQLMTEDMKTLENADAFVINGAGMEDFMDKVTEQQKNLKVIDASRGIKLIHDEEGDNPHVWLSVTDAIQQVRNIADQLKEADPAHADAYEKNAAAYIEKLTSLKTEMHAALDNVPHKDIVTFHEAFPYFAEEFHLNIIGVVEREPGTEPTPTELQETIEQVKGLSAKVLFTEPQYSPAAAETIARETGAKIYTLDPVVTGEATPAAKDAYLDTMRKNMNTLKEALQ